MRRWGLGGGPPLPASLAAKPALCDAPERVTPLPFAGAAGRVGAVHPADTQHLNAGYAVAVCICTPGSLGYTLWHNLIDMEVKSVPAQL